MMWFCSLLAVAPLALAEVVRFPGGTSPDDRRWDYLVKVLELALKKSAGVGAEDIVERLSSQPQARRIIELKQNRLDVAFGIGSKALEKEDLIFLPYPLSRGVLGWRLLLMRSDAVEKAKKVKNLDDLNALRAGFGRSFADRQLMEDNGIQMVLGEDYRGLFTMLKQGKFDYFPRAISEVFNEYENLSPVEQNLIVIEPTLAMHYDADWYFIVNPAKPYLARRIESGLLQAWRDGSLDRLFWECHRADIKAARLDNRTVIFLVNDDLPSSNLPKGWPTSFCSKTTLKESRGGARHTCTEAPIDKTFK